MFARSVGARGAKARPGTINYASAGIGSQTHLAGAYFATQAGIDIVHVPFKLSADIIADLIAGRVQVVFAPAAFTLPLLTGGKLLALAVLASSSTHDPIEVPSTLLRIINYEPMLSSKPCIKRSSRSAPTRH